MSSLQMGHLNCPVSLAKVATILSRHCRHTVCEQGSNFGVCSLPSYMPKITNNSHISFESKIK